MDLYCTYIIKYILDKINFKKIKKNTYKNHLNRKKHNAIIGNDMKVKQSTIESVRERLLMKKREREKANEAKKKK